MKNMDRGHLLLLIVTLFQGIQGQDIRPSSSNVSAGTDVSLECTTDTTQTTFSFIWNHVDSGETIYSGGNKIQPLGSYDNFDLDEDVPGKLSTLNINSILLQDAGQYRCIVSQQGSSDATINVQVGSLVKDIALVWETSNGVTRYQATCDAFGSSPVETITWILDGVTQTVGIVETNPEISPDPLFDLRSVFTFRATVGNYNATLVCEIGGHDLVPSLNRQVSRQLDVHNRPKDEGIVVGFNSQGTQLTITCNINEIVEEAVPAMNTFYIYSNGTLIPKSSDSVNSVALPAPQEVTEYTCVGGNYLGNTSITRTYNPASTTTPIPPTASESTEPVVGPNGTSGQRTVTQGLGPGAIAGIAIAALLVIIIIVVLIIVFVLKPDCVSGLGSSSGGGGGPKKHGSSSVGSSNGNDKDNFKPTPQPRQSSIKHTNENPGMAEYAMVDRKPKASSGGDMPDTRGNGAGQNEQPGMHYADLDLTPGAGHTEEKVPQNPDNVVVYSSILV